MYENATLQEAYTGSLIAGKGKLLNNIKVIMEKTRIRNEDWARVRFGAGTPWRRCWCVITPPDEKDVQKQNKQLRKKSAYERPTASPKGNIKFYDSKKIKKAKPIATINDAYSAYAIYPQSKPLIEQSTLIKVEGSITIHSSPETTTEGFVFVMPEVHPAVTGFEMLLRFLFPLYDVFALYGRPNRLIADTLDTRSLMFALPQERRYGYLEILDIAALIHETGSQTWSEREWRKKLKDTTSQRMTRMTTNGRPRSRASSYRGYRSSVVSRTGTLRYEDGASIKSTPSLHHQLQEEVAPLPPPHKPDSAPPGPNGPFASPQRPKPQHQRSFSEASPISTPRHNRSMRNVQEREYTPSRLSHEKSRPSYEASQQYRSPSDQSPLRRPSYDQPLPALPNERPPPPPAHGLPIGVAVSAPKYVHELDTANSRSSSESDRRLGESNGGTPPELRQDIGPAPPPDSVVAPPAFSHEPGAQPLKRPGISPDLRRANSRLSVTTLSQLADAGRNASTNGGVAAAGAAAAWRTNSVSSRNGSQSEDQGQRGVMNTASRSRIIADRSTSAEGLVLTKTRPPISDGMGSRNNSSASSQQDAQNVPYYKNKPLMSEYDLLTPQALTPQGSISRDASPLSQVSTHSERPRSRSNSTTSRKGKNSMILQDTEVSNGVSPQRPQASRSNTRHSISRKPVPSRTPTQTSPQRDPRPPTPVSRHSSESLKEDYVDEEALAQILALQRTRSLTSEAPNGIHDDANSIRDNDSTVSPDYASTAPRRSTETRRSVKSIEKPRRGILKTVGTVEPEPEKEVQVGDFMYKPSGNVEPSIPSDIPTVDFGPTQAYNPATGSRPTTSGTIGYTKQEKSRTPERMTPSPSAELTMSRPVGQSSNEGQEAEKPSNRKLITPEPHVRSASASSDYDNQRSMAWQPGVAIGGSPGSRPSITPEQFVQQRAVNRVTPLYAHGHKKSSSPTPPVAARQASGEIPVRGRHTPSPKPNQKRHSSYGNELPARPHSRAASNLMAGSGDYSAHLSAREQEHVARVTGSPLINMAGNTNRNSGPPGSGLVGAIEAREREKRDIKEGYSSHMVQHAIAQRQQQERSQARQSSYGAPSPQYGIPNPQYGAPSAQYATPNPQYAMPGGYPPSPVHQYPSYGTPPQQYGWGVPAQQQYAQYQQTMQYPQGQLWSPPAAGAIYGGQHQQQHQQHHQQHQQQQQQLWQQTPSPMQNQSPHGAYGPYFGNGQQGR